MHTVWFYLYKRLEQGLAQSEEHVALALTVMSLSPMLGIEITKNK